MIAMKQFRRSGAGASCGAQAEQDAPTPPPIVKLVMTEILARKFYIAVSEPAARPSIVNALFERAAQEAEARMFAHGRPKGAVRQALRRKLDCIEPERSQ
jgi:hypothetical protein